MNDPADFDDPGLRHSLRQAAGDVPDLAGARVQLAGRVTRARRRRAAAVSGAAASIVLGLGGVAALALREPTGSLRTADTMLPDTSDPASDTGAGTPDSSAAASSTTISRTTATALGSTATAPATPPSSAPTTPASTSSAPRPTTTPTTTFTTTPTTTPTTSPTTSSAPTTAAAAVPSTQTIGGEGGTITVTFANGSLTLDAAAPAAGYTTDRRSTDGSAVEVAFASAANETRIRVRIVDGRISPTVEERPNSDGDSTSTSSVSDD